MNTGEFFLCKGCGHAKQKTKHTQHGYCKHCNLHCRAAQQAKNKKGKTKDKVIRAEEQAAMLPLTFNNWGRY